MEDESSGKTCALKDSEFLNSTNLVLPELRTAQIRRLFIVTVAVDTYETKNGRIGELFFHVLNARNISVTLRNGARLFQLVLVNSQAKTQIMYETSVPTVFKTQLYSHAVALMSREVTKKALNIIWNALTSTVAGMVVQLL